MSERFFNWQSDMDWAWGPLLPLRPPRTSAMQPWVWVRLFLAFTALGLLLLALIVALCVMLPRLAAANHHTLPPVASETLSTLQAMGADPGTRLLLLGLAVSLPPLFFAFCLPYHLAWNRRAARLRGAGQEGQETSRTETPVGVWPPAPTPAATAPPPPQAGEG